MAYGSSWARGQIGAAAAGLHHSYSNARFASSATYTTAHGNAGSFNAMSRVRDRIHILMDTSQTPNPLSHSGNSVPPFYFLSHLWHAEIPGPKIARAPEQ